MNKTEMQSEKAALLQLKERLSLTEEVTGVTSWEWDIQQNMVVRSGPQEQVFGFRPESHEAWLSRVHADDKEWMTQEIDRVVQGDGVYDVEFRYVWPDGSVHWLIGKGRVFYDEDGKPLRMLGMNMDITQKKKAEQALRESREKLLHTKEVAEAANKAKSTFLAQMSHEIRTPLAAILGFVDLLLDPDITEDERFENIHIIKRNGALLLRLVNEILDLSKVEAERLEIESEPFSLNEILREVLSLMEIKAFEKGLSLHAVYLTKLPPRIVSDPVRVKQVLINLIGNAIKFTERGGVIIRVRGVPLTGADANKLGFSFSVQDTGPGLSREQQEKIFKPFSQVESSRARQYEGTGLGLVVAKKIAQALEGDLILQESQPGLGSTFTFTFQAQPVLAALSRHASQGPHPRLKKATAESAKPLTSS